ncbi:MAG: ribonuclease catalytic domain-containing protein, partial [Spirochaetota bacterium]
LDLAEAIFSGSGPRELYNAFCLLNETPYFKGQSEAVMVRSPEEVQLEWERKQRKQQEAERWQSFYRHYQEGHYREEDRPFIAEIEEIAFGERQTCRLFRELKLEGTPENAHEWLLRQRLWQDRFNPYPRRNQVGCRRAKLEELLGGNELAALEKLLRDYPEALASLDTKPVTMEVAKSVLQKLEEIVWRFCEQSRVSYPLSDEGSEGMWHSEQRRDLTHLQAWAIDDPWSNDPDDAISLERDADGELSLWVHIADPASLLPFGSTLAGEAMQRAATVYLPEGATPMLPKELVEILGLGLQPVSMALSARVRPLHMPDTNDSEAAYQPTIAILDLCRSWLQVRRLSYEQADQILEGSDPHPLKEMQQLCQSHAACRQRNHAVQFNMYNTKIVAGQSITVETLPQTPSRDLVAEAMLMTGSAMALFAHQRQIPIPFLSQQAPKEDLPPLDSMANMFQARKAMCPSVIRTEALPHSSIGVPMYTRGTSPLRRYLDLLTHQQLHAFL